MANPLDPSAFIAQFVEETRDRLRILHETLLVLEQHPTDTEALREVLRQAHTINGTARMLGLEDISRVAHLMEDLFAAVKAEPTGFVLGPVAFDALFKALHQLGTRVEQLSHGVNQPLDVQAAGRVLADLAGRSPASASPALGSSRRRRRPGRT